TGWKGKQSAEVQKAVGDWDDATMKTPEGLRKQVAAKLDILIKDKDTSAKDALVALDTDLKERLTKDLANYNQVKADLDNTGFDLFPGWRWDPKEKVSNAKNEGSWYSPAYWWACLHGHNIRPHL